MLIGTVSDFVNSNSKNHLLDSIIGVNLMVVMVLMVVIVFMVVMLLMVENHTFGQLALL